MNVARTSFVLLPFLFFVLPTTFVDAVPAISSDGREKRAVQAESMAEYYPYAVSINFYPVFPGESKYKCTASLITTESVLGAAHCVTNGHGQAEDVNKYVGYLGSENNENSRKYCDFKEFRVHPNFDAKSHRNDIAIFIIKGAVQLDDYTKTIDLLENPIALPGRYITVVGWAAPNRGSDFNNLQKANLYTVSNEECQERYGTLDGSQFCFLVTDKHPCYGNYGGAPIMFKNNGKFLQEGLTTSHCSAQKNFATLVSSYVSWIKNKAVGTVNFVTAEIPQ